jgi:hypothetical protein
MRPEHMKKLKVESKRRRKYNVEPAEYAAAWMQQMGLCPICLRALGGGDPRSTHTDHDHVTGKFRGILCNPCNRGLGYFRDRIDRLNRAIEYLATRR